MARPAPLAPEVARRLPPLFLPVFEEGCCPYCDAVLVGVELGTHGIPLRVTCNHGHTSPARDLMTKGS